MKITREQKIAAAMAPVILALLGFAAWQLFSGPLRGKPLRQGGDASTVNRYRDMIREVDQTVNSVQSRMFAETPALDLTQLSVKKTPEASITQGTARSGELPFKVQGIVKSPRNPLVILEDRTVGIGEKVDGFTVREIASDSVTFTDESGRARVVRLYADE